MGTGVSSWASSGGSAGSWAVTQATGSQQPGLTSGATNSRLFNYNPRIDFIAANNTMLGNSSTATDSTSTPTFSTKTYWKAIVRGPDGLRSGVRIICGSLDDPTPFREHLVEIARIEDPVRTDDGEAWIGRYELELRPFTEEGDAVIFRW